MNLTPFLLRSFRTAIVLPVIAGLVAGAGSATLIALINVRLGSGDAAWPWLAAGFAGLAVIVLASNYLTQVLLLRLSQGAAFDLSMRLSERVLAAPLRHQEQLGAHRIMTALTEDVPAVVGALLSVPALCINLATLAVLLVYLGWLSQTVLAVMLVFMAVGIGARQLLVKGGLASLRRAREESNALMSHYRALTEGAKELKLHGARRQVFFRDMLKAAAQAQRQHAVAGWTVYAAAESGTRFLYYIFLGVVLFMLPQWQAVSLHTLTGYALVVLYLIGPLAGILTALPALGRARIALRQIDELKLALEAAAADSDGELTRPVPGADWGRLELAAVTHSYRTETEDHNFTLGPLDLEFVPGEVVFLVGGNGSGKTTLAKLLVGLYAPESGEVRLDGEVITDETRESYRQHFSAVFSDFYLFERLLGGVGPDLDAKAREYLAKLQLSHKVQVRDGALSTTELSFGQRKRLALLNAYLEDRPFYVFDEWAAGQDPVFKEVFYTQLLPELKREGKTVVVITHDESYFHLADRRLRLDYGSLVDSVGARIVAGGVYQPS
jgi:putative ATP-binding cassette transporter